MRLKFYVVMTFMVCGLPGVIYILVNFFFYRRGWHSDEMERQVFGWALRILLSPAVIFVSIKLFDKITSALKLFIFETLSMVIYNVLYFSLCSLIWAFFAKGYDGRFYNLFNTVKDESLLINMLIFSITVLVVYSVLHLDKTVLFSKTIEEFRKALAVSSEKNKYSGTSKLERITIRQGHRNIILPVEDIYFLQSKGPYVKIATATGAYMLSARLYDLNSQLPSTFLRIHRSRIINSSFIKEIRSLMNGDYTVFLKDDSALRASRTYRDNIRTLIG